MPRLACVLFLTVVSIACSGGRTNDPGQERATQDQTAQDQRSQDQTPPDESSSNAATAVQTDKKPSRQANPKNATEVMTDPQFEAQMQKLEETWVNEFNAGHADKVAALYADDAVLMRWDGSVHGKDSIVAEMQRSIAAGTHDYVVHSLRRERSGDIGYDTGAYNVSLRTRVVEGNFLVVAKRISGEWKIVAHASVPNPALPSTR